MKPIKGLTVFSLWLLRVMILVFALSTFGQQIKHFSFQNTYSIFAALFIIAAIFLFLGGFWKKNTTTVLSALILTALSIYQIFDTYEGLSFQMLTGYSVWGFVLGITLLFAATGNKA